MIYICELLKIHHLISSKLMDLSFIFTCIWHDISTVSISFLVICYKICHSQHDIPIVQRKPHWSWIFRNSSIFGIPSTIIFESYCFSIWEYLFSIRSSLLPFSLPPSGFHNCSECIFGCLHKCIHFSLIWCFSWMSLWKSSSSCGIYWGS